MRQPPGIVINRWWTFGKINAIEPGEVGATGTEAAHPGLPDVPSVMVE
jgi:hypothetical protein